MHILRNFKYISYFFTQQEILGGGLSLSVIQEVCLTQLCYPRRPNLIEHALESFLTIQCGWFEINLFIVLKILIFTMSKI